MNPQEREGYFIQDGCWNCRHFRTWCEIPLCGRERPEMPEDPNMSGNAYDWNKADEYHDAMTLWMLNRDCDYHGICDAWEEKKP